MKGEGQNVLFPNEKNCVGLGAVNRQFSPVQSIALSSACQTASMDIFSTQQCQCRQPPYNMALLPKDSSLLKSEWAMRFDRSGNRTPPCGVALQTIVFPT